MFLQEVVTHLFDLFGPHTAERTEVLVAKVGQKASEVRALVDLVMLLKLLFCFDVLGANVTPVVGGVEL